MKNLLIASTLAVLAASAIVSTASAQNAAGGPNGGSRGDKGPSSTDGGRGDPSNCVPGALCRPTMKKVVALGEGCGCTVKKVRIGGRISYIQDCYYFDVKANLERYCQPWQRTSAN
ncbi:hypothetical protein DFR52_102480 [Hoeflea marina]|uniref:Uncharacterized protein n=1 Tax=Hoeflea marina TaxID=274592 RepID=A0A317PM47_9HYPH|nr:hypothetical protein [Hoeflea marina]PWW01816.1 hypothetical protein DFR52_102480 [Hoeflea marina]